MFDSLPKRGLNHVRRVHSFKASKLSGPPAAPLAGENKACDHVQKDLLAAQKEESPLSNHHQKEGHETNPNQLLRRHDGVNRWRLFQC